MPFLNVDIFEDLPGRLKESVNPYVSILKNEEDLPLKFGTGLKSMRGNWSSYFKKGMGQEAEKIFLEIGCHKGNVLQQMSRDFPKHAHIGMDITMKRVVLSARKLKAIEAKNGSVVLGNAKQLDKIFQEAELDGVLLFFPDPWTKKASQSHNQLLSEDFVKILFSVLKPGAFFWFKTDSELYFNQSLQYLNKYKATRFLESPLGKNYESTFEERFKGQGKSTYELILRKN